MSTILHFRREINGLRAIAVISVVLFHFNSSWLPGGFAGVDIFFVISGFLMTKIIFTGMEQGSFSVLNFYIARANRIIPALAALCIVLLLFGWFYLIPLDYRDLGKHAASSIGFFSNFVYLKESGYFDASSHEKWLLHTWSLSVEWQFYIIYPLVLVVLRKIFSLNLIKTIVLISTFFGLIFCVIATYKWPDSAYYLFPSRAWELMFGGLAFLYPQKINEKFKQYVEYLGLFFIVFSVLFFTKESPWPGYLAVFPVFGTFLIIQAQRSGSFITGNFVFQKIGCWSYSIYLWHWPIVVGLYYFSFDDTYIFLGGVLSVFFGFLSYTYIEQFRLKNSYPNITSSLKSKPIYIVAIISIFGGYTYFSDGIDNRFYLKPELRIIKDELIMPLRNNGYCFYSFNDSYSIVDKDVGSSCFLGSKVKNTSTLLFGDSYAGHNEPFFDVIFKANNASFQSIVTNWCTPSLTDNFTGPKSHLAYKQCLINRSYLKNNMHKYKNIIFAGSWDSVLSKSQFEDVESVIEKSANLGVNVFIMAAPQRYQNNPLRDFYRNLYFDIQLEKNTSTSKDTLMVEGNLRLKKISEKYNNVHFIGRELLYSKQNTFKINELVIPYSLDGGHISILGSKYSAKYFMSKDKYKEIISEFNL
jgi:peptidoglycan/LPS O-acetylase OafA/YrhL